MCLSPVQVQLKAQYSLKKRAKCEIQWPVAALCPGRRDCLDS
jgi:hypothetical protein